MKPLFAILALTLGLSVTACDQPGSSNKPVQSTLDQAEDVPPNENGAGNGGAGGAAEPVCALHQTTASSQPQAGIVGGEAVQTDSWIAKGVVFVVQEYQVDRETKTSICTGSLIDKNLVLTAAHCVDKSQNNTAQLSVYFTAIPECDSQHGRLHQSKKSVAEVRIHPNWTTNSTAAANRGDLAMIRIYGKAPNTYEPLKLTKEFIPLNDAQKITVAGYGMTNPNYYGDFGGSISLRFAEATPISATEKTYLTQLTDDAAEFSNLSANEMLYIDQSQGRGVCGGDSGGPSFLKNAAGEPVVTGVASYVMNPRDSTRLCAYVAAHTSTYFHKIWIETTFRAMRTAESSYETPFR